MQTDEVVPPAIMLERPIAPPILLSVGSALWKGIAYWGNIDFILSMRQERLAMIFQSFLDYGWAVLLVVGIVWGLQARRPTKVVKVQWGIVTVVGLLAFMFGALATSSTTSLPRVISAWGGELLPKIRTSE